VAAPAQRLGDVGRLGDGDDVVAAPAQRLGDVGRELLVDERIHASSARRPASQAA
jgi:hypothetical protein